MYCITIINLTYIENFSILVAVFTMPLKITEYTMATVKRIFVEKKPGFDVAAQELYEDLTGYLGVTAIKQVRLLVRYDMEGVSAEEYRGALATVFSEPPVDTVYELQFPCSAHETAFAIEYLPGQYDQRADSAAQCIQIMAHGGDHHEPPVIKSARVIVLKGDIAPADVARVKQYLINPVDSHEVSLEIPQTLRETLKTPPDVATVTGFISFTESELKNLCREMGLAMSYEDICHCQRYFAGEEQRDPTVTEIRVLDTYWSDHCRHTTFQSKIESVEIEDSPFSRPIKRSFDLYRQCRSTVYEGREKNECLMDIALMGMKYLKKQGKLEGLEVSREINACSIVVPAIIDGKVEEWLVMFKNETHNHPTEIEPFGGAATCLGGAIRDPLSGRSYVYQAMRVTGCGDPRKSLAETIKGKLSQRKISTEAAHGYSSYGNQIGLATGLVNEIYHEGYLAKHMEIGAVIAAVPRTNVLRGEPAKGDVVVLLGGRTGRDGIGGATGSSKEHTEESIETCGAEVQKGNPPTERKIQRLFRNPKASTMIKVCNDFGAGGVSVAIGELAEGLEINLDAVPKKYDGLDGTELSISESQERMAVLLDPANETAFIALAEEENLEAIRVATVTDKARMTMRWRSQTVVDISRSFIDTNGATQRTSVKVSAPAAPAKRSVEKADIHDTWLNTLADLNVCSQKGCIERFDSTIGAASVLLPFGGLYQDTPTESMVAKLPVLTGDTATGTIMGYGFDPELSLWSPFHGALNAVVHSVARIVAAGADYTHAWLTLQEYFEKLGSDPSRWGKPFSALLGAFYAQVQLEIAAIGGKDSMSGTFENISVPPTLVSFAVAPVDVSNTISPEFKRAGNQVWLLPVKTNADRIPDFDYLKRLFSAVTAAIANKSIISAYTVGKGGVAAAISKMSFGNRIGFTFTAEGAQQELFTEQYGAFIVEMPAALANGPATVDCVLLGHTTTAPIITTGSVSLPLNELYEHWTRPLDSVFPAQARTEPGTAPVIEYSSRNTGKAVTSFAKPRVIIPVFPGTNCEYDSARAFERAGAAAETFVINNLDGDHIEKSLAALARKIGDSQIVMLPGGFSAGDEPDGSGKFITAVFRNPVVRDAVNDLLGSRGGLMLGICNGFQALVKLGLVPFGEICDLDEAFPTLTFNTIGRHISRMVYTRVSSTLSPWFSKSSVGDTHAIAVSHGEGRFVASDELLKKLASNGQIATQYARPDGTAADTIEFNPNGSMWAIEGISSADGRVLGKMGHSERVGANVAKNICGAKDQLLFESGVAWFR